MIRTHTAHRLALAVAAVCGSMIVGCVSSNDPPPFDPRSMQSREQTAAAGIYATTQRALPTTLESDYRPDKFGQPKPTTLPYAGPSIAGEPQARLSLQEIMQRAVINNSDIKVAGFTPAIDQTRVTEAEARFDPTYFANLSFEYRDRPSALNTAGASSDIDPTTGAVIPGSLFRDRQDIWTGQTGIRQNLPSGGQAELRLQDVRTRFPGDVTGVTLNPYYSSDLIFQLTQPLLRDFGNDINSARITINRNTQRTSLLDFRKQVEDSIIEIERTYWQLVQAEREVKIAEDLLSRTVDTSQKLLARIRQDVTPTQLSQANSQLELRTGALARARAQVKNFSDDLKRLMNDPDYPVAGPTVILPAEPPVLEPVKFDRQEALNTALKYRFELFQQQLRVDSADIAMGVAKNNLLPQLNLVGQAGTADITGGFWNSLAQQSDFQADSFNWQLGFQFEVPIGNRAARAVYARALLQRMQAVESYRGLIATISNDVTKAIREVETTWEEAYRARNATFAALDALRGIEIRQQNQEPLTPTFIDTQLNTQERYSDAQRQEAAAISNYNLSLARLEQAKGTLLRYNNIRLQEETIPYVKTLAH